jgi:hypothetical protein
MLYYQEGTTEPSNCSGVLKHLANYLTPSCVCLVGYIRPSRTFSSDSRGLAASPGRTYPRLDISDQPDLSDLHWVSEPWQLPWSDISDPRSDISNIPDLSEPRRVRVPCHPPLI